jgi:hypothetical protein
LHNATAAAGSSIEIMISRGILWYMRMHKQLAANNRFKKSQPVLKHQAL